ncbi:MAG TPA: exonuclease SbcCD subunit D [Defluviitoga sp.]|nr:exonuclease SbcCD subunit D [Defluviitoga sp.]HPU59729.1 exonuclease SbcCD subunit D [Defluviitoga tunisiensis]HPZ74340.1 exonuclease SbcCD subunit D [Candidatus Pacearchaeota archaeon]
MKILHTADWHIGKIIYGEYMLDDQRYILSQLLNYLKEESVDALVISGDLFDRAVPPAEAINLLNETLSKIVLEFRIPTIIISGNHDSAERLEFLNGILSGMDLHIEGVLKDEVKKVTYTDEYGLVNFFLLPYVDFFKARDLFGMNFKNKTEVISKFIEKMSIDENERNILVAHEYVLGGEESESERVLSIGGSEYIEPSIFEVFDYVALGHLHRPQNILSQKICYPGSLLKYSFSESYHEKGMNIVDFKEKGNINIQKLRFKVKRDMRVIKGFFKEVMEKEQTDDYLHVILEDENIVVEGMNKLKSRFPNVLSLEYPNSKTNKNIKSLEKDIQKISPIELFEIFFKEVKGRELNLDEKEIVKSVFEVVISERSDEV